MPHSPQRHPFLRQGLVPSLVMVLTLSLWGCVTPPIPGARPDLLAFLVPGQTTREEVILTLGQPSASFEQEHILTYRLGEDPQQGLYVISPKALLPWQLVKYSLVLVFDARGRLQQQNRVPVQ